MKRCPGCSEPLFRRPFGALELDGCRSCGGVWFDGGELGQAARAYPDALREADRFFRQGLQPSLAPQRLDVCPSCSGSLADGEHPSFVGIAMRMCAACRGVFLPEGSGAALTARLTGEAPAPVPAIVATVANPTSTHHLPIVRGAFIARDVAPSSGFFSAFSRALTFLGATFRLARAEPRLLVPTAIGTAINVALVLLMALTALLLIPLAGGSETARALDDQKVLLGVLFAAFSFVGHVATWATMGMTVSAVDAYVKGQPIDIRVAARDVLENIGGVMVLSIVSMIVEALTSSLRRRRGIAGLFVGVVASAIDAVWTTLSFLLLPVIMIEDVGLFAAVARVRGMHRNNLLTIAASEIGIRLVTGIGGFIVVGTLAGLFAVIRPEGVLPLVVFFSVAGLAALLFNGLAVFLRATYYTCLYLWAAAREASPEAAQLCVPGPLAEAFL
ncbi:MAG: hypothetical protein DRJ42_05920 [Deltaproteobacteria bacterium]|nr:MAG: hypothetical protein DRJ42_05920 [Deltaproteobacteria bacterium]